jgi:OmcA/MtrC family decaheme c-type cytochrome
MKTTNFRWLNMNKQYSLRLCQILLVSLALTACSGGGSSAVAPDVSPGPASSNGNPPASPPIQTTQPPNTYATATAVNATITNVTVASPPVLELSVVDQNGVALTGLQSSNLRFTLAKLIPGNNGNSTSWQSYINRTKTPAVVPTNAAAIQATSESGGTLVDHQDGTYTYTFVTDITQVTAPLAVTYEPSLTHRVAIQFSGGPVANPVFDWVPASGLTSGIFSREVVATASCNNCHDPLAFHGGGRQDTKLCVTCHNPGTTEPNSLNAMDLKVMVHKIHRGRQLPSVVAGGKYQIYGFRDSLHDYSDVNFPQQINNCTTCHTGTGTTTATAAATVTSEGDNWAEVPTMAACGSCHDTTDFATHNGGQTDNSGCLSCHSATGIPGSIAASHKDQVREAMAKFDVKILSVTNSAPGQFPRTTFTITDPTNADRPYDLATDAPWQGARLTMGLALSTTDFTNTGLTTGLPRYATTNALTQSVANGDGTYTVTSAVAIPDGSVTPNRAATGSGMVTFEGRARVDVGDAQTPNVQNIPFVQPHQFFAINEASGQASPRRTVVDIQQCNQCHSLKSNHGGNRTDNPIGCAGCHNPRNTDKAVRLLVATPPTDGKTESSIDFKVLIHAIHASGYREAPYQVVGFQGRSVHVFDTEEVQYPGRLANCKSCHVGNSYQLPLAAGVLATSIDTGASATDPSDDKMVTPTAAVCSSCHDTSLAKAHMEQNGADFTATEGTINSGVSTEACTICHGPGRVADIDRVHGLQ